MGVTLEAGLARRNFLNPERESASLRKRLANSVSPCGRLMGLIGSSEFVFAFPCSVCLTVSPDMWGEGGETDWVKDVLLGKRTGKGLGRPGVNHRLRPCARSGVGGHPEVLGVGLSPS